MSVRSASTGKSGARGKGRLPDTPETFSRLKKSKGKDAVKDFPRMYCTAFAFSKGSRGSSETISFWVGLLLVLPYLSMVFKRSMFMNQ